MGRETPDRDLQPFLRTGDQALSGVEGDPVLRRPAEPQPQASQQSDPGRRRHLPLEMDRAIRDSAGQAAHRQSVLAPEHLNAFGYDIIIPPTLSRAAGLLSQRDGSFVSAMDAPFSS